MLVQKENVQIARNEIPVAAAVVDAVAETSIDTADYVLQFHDIFAVGAAQMMQTDSSLLPVSIQSQIDGGLWDKRVAEAALADAVTVAVGERLGRLSIASSAVRSKAGSFDIATDRTSVSTIPVDEELIVGAYAAVARTTWSTAQSSIEKRWDSAGMVMQVFAHLFELQPR